MQAAHANMRQFIVQNADDFLLKPLFETSPNSKVPSLLNYLPEMANGSKLFNRGILAFCLQAAGKKNNDARLNNASLEMSTHFPLSIQSYSLFPHIPELKLFGNLKTSFPYLYSNLHLRLYGYI